MVGIMIIRRVNSEPSLGGMRRSTNFVNLELRRL